MATKRRRRDFSNSFSLLKLNIVCHFDLSRNIMDFNVTLLNLTKYAPQLCVSLEHWWRFSFVRPNLDIFWLLASTSGPRMYRLGFYESFYRRTNVFLCKLARVHKCVPIVCSIPGELSLIYCQTHVAYVQMPIAGNRSRDAQLNFTICETANLGIKTSMEPKLLWKPFGLWLTTCRQTPTNNYLLEWNTVCDESTHITLLFFFST